MTVLTIRELDLVRALEKIATGASGDGAHTDVVVMRQIAVDALAAIRWGNYRASQSEGQER
ncbi:hypothetical protein Hden_1168 [Hyphomicrobium denitrificans ATCC 51888]|uniref:Uncharacterized protein n=1 Tax=Hyphomicrobium denitrificans (strain ATCC 51888 / DSM 1869 / NCIMB 11706 / TK 0415) TaxID=582899 RepID=D8JVU2_HYPDA|nr:hypothetical protein Hden_1168 [Hyphomicrobium denitrificans ATCC 51888]